MKLNEGDICLVKGKAGLYLNGAITMPDLTIVNTEPDYVIRIGDDKTTGAAGLDLPCLELGNHGIYVAIMQTCLKWHGYLPGERSVDGIIGTQTLAALRKFRLEHYLNGDTVCDGDTWRMLLTE